jgi:hypothetical protein
MTIAEESFLPAVRRTRTGRQFGFEGRPAAPLAGHLDTRNHGST